MVRSGRWCYYGAMISIYVETSFFSACVTDRSDLQSTVWRETSRRWWQALADVSNCAYRRKSSPSCPRQGLTTAPMRLECWTA